MTRHDAGDHDERAPAPAHRVVLVEAAGAARDVVADRLRQQGFDVEIASTPAAGAHAALSRPPSVIVADLWMPSISGVQLCRLLRSEPATEHVPVILRGPEGPRDRFWAQRAGASAYVPKGRVGELVRAIGSAVAREHVEPNAFFTQLGGGEEDLRDRIAAHLDAALFDSVLAAEVRALGVNSDFERFFDGLAQLLAQLAAYRWMAVTTRTPERLAIHAPPAQRRAFEEEARAALGLRAEVAAISVEDDDAHADLRSSAPLIRAIAFGADVVGRLAMSPRAASDQDPAAVLDVVARELGGPIRMVSLVEESQRLARLDVLTQLLNRRAFVLALEHEVARSERHGWPLSALMIDVDHFKTINDTHGHATGDRVLASIGALLPRECRKVDLPARWGGEEFVVLLTGSDRDGAMIAAERIRKAIEAMIVANEQGERVLVTASIGVTAFVKGDDPPGLLERADRAMYVAKRTGRNRVYAMAREPIDVRTPR